ncbi:hypothetical protein HZS_4743 [Henneguya salminicola]|nr:hypothetical protein HZS_4743 [Henneguya salminicola]
MYRKVLEKARENVAITYQTAMRDFEKVSRSIFKMFAAFAFINDDNIIRACLNGFEQSFRELLNYNGDIFLERYHCKYCSESSFPLQILNKSKQN